MATTPVLATLSLNCHGFHNGTVNYLRRVAIDLDFVLLQETWQCDATVHRLTDSMDGYLVLHSSAMEHKLSEGIHLGRPFGGTAVLINKRLSKFIHPIVTDNPRVTTVCYSPKVGNDLIISSIYMPFDDGTNQHYSGWCNAGTHG